MWYDMAPSIVKIARIQLTKAIVREPRVAIQVPNSVNNMEGMISMSGNLPSCYAVYVESNWLQIWLSVPHRCDDRQIYRHFWRSCGHICWVLKTLEFKLACPEAHLVRLMVIGHLSGGVA